MASGCDGAHNRTHGPGGCAVTAGSSVPEPAVGLGEDPRRYARLLSQVYDATMAGGKAAARPRPVIADSWNRLLGKGIDPEHHCPPDVDTSGLDMLRQSSGL